MLCWQSEFLGLRISWDQTYVSIYIHMNITWMLTLSHIDTHDVIYTGNDVMIIMVVIDPLIRNSHELIGFPSTVELPRLR